MRRAIDTLLDAASGAVTDPDGAARKLAPLLTDPAFVNELRLLFSVDWLAPRLGRAQHPFSLYAFAGVHRFHPPHRDECTFCFRSAFHGIHQRATTRWDFEAHEYLDWRGRCLLCRNQPGGAIHGD